jgi:S-formylglutathione hydrolase FrmB
VIYPENPEFTSPLPVMYLLAGGFKDDTHWSRFTNIENYVRDLPMITVMLGSEGAYIDWIEGPPGERMIIEELIPFVERMFNTKASRDGRAIGGLSYGGYAAVKFALKYPHLFCSVVSHSGALSISKYPDKAYYAEYTDQYKWSALSHGLGPSPAGGKDCLFYLAEQVDPTSVPAIRFDCGTEDVFLGENREFAEHLVALGIPHEYEEFPGEHNWLYWDNHVQEAIEFHKTRLSI